MRRNSPPRFGRRNSPPRRGGRITSPPSRNQPLPPGEERGRKINQWDAQIPHKRPRSRSRERLMHSRDNERDRQRRKMDREPPHLSIAEKESRERFDRSREPRRDGPSKEERLPDRSRETQRERDRAFHAPRMEGNNEADFKLPKRHSLERSFGHNEGFEENYLDQHKSNFDMASAFNNKHEEPILDPSSITFSTYPPDKTRENSRDIRHLPPRSNASGSFDKQEKSENPEDRINRLEKLVKKLVEGNAKSSESKENNYPQSKDVVSELIPSNNKFTTSMWINRIHEECLHRNYEEKSSIRYMQDKMTGIMKAWFKTVSNYDFTWPELKLLITKTFPDNIDFAQTLKLLVARDKTSDETITQYYFSKVYLCEACKITGENAVSCLIDGLSNPFLKQDIKSYNFLTPEALYSEYLSKYPEQDTPIRVDRREVRLEPEMPNEDFIPLEVQDRVDYRPYLNVPGGRGDRFSNRLAPPTERPRCLTCKKLGHLTIDCRHAPICYKCKKKGHIAAKCHSNIMLISSLNNTLQNAPMVKCKVQGKTFDGIIDTGAAAVTMTRKIAKTLHLNIKKTKEVLKGYGGSLISPLGEVDVELTVNSTPRLVRTLVVEDEVQDDLFIVGQEFLSKNVSISIQDGRVEVSDTSFKGLQK